MSFWQMLEGTPWWVWVVFVYVIIIGIKTTKPQIVSLYRLLIVPFIFVFLSLHTLWLTPMNFLHISVFIMTMLIGIGAGFWQISRLFIEVDRRKKLLSVPGSPVTLILVLIVFVSKYYFGFTEAVHPEMMQNDAFILSMLALSGVCSGIFIGRAVCYICRFVSLPHKELQPGS